MDTKVITNIPGKSGGFWHAHTVLIGPTQPSAWLKRCVGANWAVRLANLIVAFRLFLRRSSQNVIVTGGGLDGLTFAALQSLLPFGRRPHVLVDCYWYLPRSRWGQWLRSLRIRWAARSAERFVVWASHEVEDYASAFGVPPEKFLYVPFHTTLDFYEFTVRDDGYVFAGGDSVRDYPTLVEAVRPLDVPLWIATTRPQQLQGITIPAHVRVEATSAGGFRHAMGAAKLVVVPMQGGLLRSGGQQTCLNAMWMGKPTIAVGRRWATDLMEDGVHGLIVDYGDVAGLRRALQWVFDNPEKAAEMARRGQAHAQKFTTHRCMETIHELALRPVTTGANSLAPRPQQPEEVACSGS